MDRGSIRAPEKLSEGLMKQRTVASAPGKVLVCGGYLVLERPHQGLVLSLSSRFR